jgi:calcium-dependent protein kinase
MAFGDSGKEKLKRMTTRAGTLFFMAPEVLTVNYSNKWDIWSAGIILYIMLCGYPPFASEEDSETIQLIMEGEIEFDDDAWEDISPEAKDLIVQILQPESLRISAKKILSHPWIKKYVHKEAKGNLLDNQINKLKQFQSKSKFRKTILSYLSWRVSDEDVINQK